MYFRPRQNKRAKGGRRFSRTHQSRRPFQSGRFVIEPLESRRLLAANLGILLLDHTGMPALYSAGSGGVHVTGGGSLVIDSHDRAAAVDVGPGNITAGEIHVTGGLMDLGPGQFQGTVSHPAALADPLAGLAAPPITTPVHGAVYVKGNTSITLSPGTYNGGIHISGNAQVTLLPGIYNLQGGGLSVVENGSLTGTGVMIYNGAKKLSDKILIGGNATVTLSAPTSGTYKNVVIFQNRNSKAPVTITGGNIHLTGAVYAPNAPLFFDTNRSMFIQGSADQGINGQLIVFKIVRLGAGSINVDATNNQVADLAITLTDDTTQPTSDLVQQEVTPNVAVTTAVPGQSVTYTITVTNNGPRPVTGAVVKDTFPSAITSDSFTAVGTGGAAGFTASGTGNINDTVDLPVGATITYTVIAQIASSATGSLTNTATVTAPADPPDPNLANNTATDTDTLTPIADLAITKSDNSTTAVPGAQVSYTIIVTNNGPSDVTGATVSDTIPSAFTSYTVTGSNGFTKTGSGGTAFTDTGANLASGATITYTVTGTLSQTVTGDLTNTAIVAAPSGTTDPTSSNNSSTDTDTLVPLVDLVVTKTDNADTAVPGHTVTYTIKVTNNGPSAVTSIVLTDTLPSALSGVSFTPVEGSYNSSTGVWSGLNLTTGTTVTMQVSGTIDPAATGQLTNSVSVLPPEGVNESNGANNSASDTDTLAPEVDLGVTKTDNQTSAVPGTSVTYTITVTNSGPSTVSSLTLTDTLPALTGVTFTPSTGNYNSGTGVWSGLTLAAGQSITMQVSGTIDPAATGTLVNSVTVAPPSGTTDTNSGNDTASDTDTLTPQVDLSVTKTDNQTTAVPGTNITYTIVVSNSGPSTATGVTVNDVLPSSIAFVTSTSTQGSYNSSTGLATIGTIAPGASVTLTITGTVSPTATGTVANTATVSGTVTDTNSGNNSATDTDTLTPQADLSVTKDDGSESVFAGNQVTYTITVTNNGPSTVTSLTLTDPIPAELLNPVFTPASGNYDSGTGVWSGLNLASGQSVSMTLVATVSGQAEGTLSNTATVAPPSGVTDPTPGNNSATDTDSIFEQIG